MTSLLDRLAPGFTAKVNLFFDLVLMFAALELAGRITASAAAPTWLKVLALVFYCVLLLVLRHYDTWAYERRRLEDAASLSTAMVSTSALMALAAFFFGLPLYVALAPLGAWPIALSMRLWIFFGLAHHEGELDEVLIVGAGALGRATAQDLMKLGRRRVVGHLLFDGDSADGLRAAALGPVEELEQTLCTTEVSEVFIAGNLGEHRDEMQAVVKVCERFGVAFALPAYEVTLERAQPGRGHGIRDGYLHFLSVDWEPHRLAVKRVFDIFASGVALLVLAPLFAAVALAIKLSSPGPVFFRQVRCGLHGRLFRMLKFRSMVVNAEALRAALVSQNEQRGPVFKIARDPRVTRVGAFIRKFSIDELPQLINVLRGDMSVVGPRPGLPGEVAQYQPWQRRRLSVRPGLTCVWQVSGRSRISFEQWMYLDMEYIDHWSLRRDFDLIVKTVPAVLTGRGAS